MAEVWKMAKEGDGLVGQSSESAASIETRYQPLQTPNHLWQLPFGFRRELGKPEYMTSISFAMTANI